MTVKELKDIINEIPTKDDNQKVIFHGRRPTDFWWIDTSGGYVCGFDEEVESDGFITREEDLMMRERTAKPMQECKYPECEECDKCVDGYCTVPMVISKQIYRYVTIELAELTVKVNELEKLVYDEILGNNDKPRLDFKGYHKQVVRGKEEWCPDGYHIETLDGTDYYVEGEWK